MKKGLIVLVIWLLILSVGNAYSRGYYHHGGGGPDPMATLAVGACAGFFAGTMIQQQERQRYEEQQRREEEERRRQEELRREEELRNRDLQKQIDDLKNQK
jgi:membrane protein involved in colicin uptake